MTAVSSSTTAPLERFIRSIILNRKNALFAGSDGGAEHCTVIASLIEPAS
jgi:transposase